MTDLMEWYFGSDVDDLVVPNDQVLFDGFPSPINWSVLEHAALGSFDFPKSCVATTPSSAREEHNFDGTSFCNEVEINTSRFEGRNPGNSSFCQELCYGSLPWVPSPSHRQPNHRLDDHARIEEMDDIFLLSFSTECLNLYADDLSRTDNFHGYLAADDNHSADIIPESFYVPSTMDCRRNSTYLKSHAFSPSNSWDNEEVANCCPQVKVSVLSEHDVVNELMDEEAPTEESALYELERLTIQLPKKMRICFRDALYRLADNSKRSRIIQEQCEDLILEKHHPMMVHDESLSSTTEPKTNSIDRAIAHLLFNQIDDGEEETSTAAALNFKEEGFTRTGQFNNTTNPLEIILVQDAEVPIFVHEN